MLTHLRQKNDHLHLVQQARRRILFVDDNKSILTLLTLQLKKHGYELITASSAQEAFDILRLEDATMDKATVDLILMDIQMPEVDGIKACRIIKSVQQYADIPILMLTCHDNSSYLQSAFQSGAVDYIRKPYRKEELIARIEAFLKLKDELQRRKAREEALTEITRQLKASNNTLKNLSAMDHLTGLANRRTFDQQIVAEWKRAKRSGKPLSLLLIDVDFFKKYNDTYGHMAGDHCLVRIASALKSVLKRPGDTLARYGGEEFAVILPETDARGAFVIAEELRVHVLSLEIVHDLSPHNVVTISSGVGTIIPSQKDSITQFIYDTDQALYLSKKKGRNEISVSTATPTALLEPSLS